MSSKPIELNSLDQLITTELNQDQEGAFKLLPNEDIRKIFTYIKAPQDVKTFALVNHRFK